MGFAANSAYLMMLISRRADLQLRAQFISQHRMYLAASISGFFSMSTRLEPNSHATKILESRIKILEQTDKMLEMELNRIQGQHQAVESEIQSVQKLIQKNIEGSFGLMGR